MKLAIVLCALIAVTLAKFCDHDHPCTCPHSNEVANCEKNVCNCVSTGPGVGKRETLCTSDADCSGYDCHGNGTPTCIHHGSAEHGHMNCGCHAH